MKNPLLNSLLKKAPLALFCVCFPPIVVLTFSEFADSPAADAVYFLSFLILISSAFMAFNYLRYLGKPDLKRMNRDPRLLLIFTALLFVINAWFLIKEYGFANRPDGLLSEASYRLWKVCVIFNFIIGTLNFHVYAPKTIERV